MERTCRLSKGLLKKIYEMDLKGNMHGEGRVERKLG